jgi:glucose/arabinose dehydrogenase
MMTLMKPVNNQKSLLPPYFESLGFPVTLVFSPDDRAFLSERITGHLWEIKEDDFRLVRAFPIVPIIGHHETGLLGIALDPDFAENRFIYCYYTTGPNPKKFFNRVVRVKDDGSDEEILLDNIPAGWIHNGGIIAFAPDKSLYIGIGVNNEEKEKSQDLKFLGGKILRINRDGSFPKDNPFPNSPVYSYGHRNIFGLAFHPQTGKLYFGDVGPDKNDEINISQKGGNYGWPMVMGVSGNPKLVDPITTYTPPITPTQMTFADGQLYFGSYNEGAVHRLTLSGENFDKVEKDEVVYQGEPFSLIGVFRRPQKEFYVATTNSILLMA